MDLLRSAPLNVVLVMNVEENSPVRAQSVVRSLRDAGHHITLFACSARGKLIPVVEDPPSPLNGVNQMPQELLRDKIHNADGVILISDHPPCEVPDCLLCACTQHFNGHMYSWISYGLTCSLLGGLVHNRRVAMQLRWLLEDSQNLLVGRILPRPCYFEKLYSVDPMFETPEPCVL